MKLDSEFIKQIQSISKTAGGYLTVELYDKNRGSLPSWDTLKKKLNNIEFVELLKITKVMSKDEYNFNKNRIKAISNFKIINLEYGFVSTAIYDELKLEPTSDYISKKYGWSKIAEEANVKLANNQYTSIDEMILELKNNIKKLGYIPTLKEYEKLLIKPSRKSFASQEIQWSDAMSKAGYRTYGKPVKTKDRVCANADCYKQFTPSNKDEIYCINCFKDLRAKLVREVEKLNVDELRDVTKKLIYSSTAQKIVLDALKVL
jgi:hypothetical protein